jgi:hypothetical protein
MKFIFFTFFVSVRCSVLLSDCSKGDMQLWGVWVRTTLMDQRKTANIRYWVRRGARRDGAHFIMIGWHIAGAMAKLNSQEGKSTER